MATAAAASSVATTAKPSSSSSAKGTSPAPSPAALPGQRVGLASALLVEEASASRSGGANRATFRLTPELVLQIFAERPYVRAAYASAVPRVCGEAEFWKRYLRYEAVRKARRRLKAAGRDPNEAGPEDELFRQFRAERRAEAYGEEGEKSGGGGRGEAKGKASSSSSQGEAQRHHAHSHIDPGVDLEADAADNAPPGYGLAHAGARDPSVGGGSAARPRSAATAAAAAERDAIVHELNRHAAVVLAGVPPGLPADAAAAARALKEGPVGGVVAAAAGGGAAETNITTPAAAAAAKGAKATAAAASAARDREESERWRDRAGAGLDDLNPAPEEEFEALTVADPRGYFGGDGEREGEGEVVLNNSSSKAWSPDAIVAALRAPTKKQHSALLTFDAFSLFQPQDAVAALRDLALAAAAGEETVSADDLMLAAATGSGGSGSLSAAAALAADPAAALPPPLLALLRQAALTANELLRHFWASAEARSGRSSSATASAAAAAAARSSRVVKALGTQYDRIQAMQGAASSGSERAAVRRLLAPVAAAIDVAMERAAELERGGVGGAAMPMETN